VDQLNQYSAQPWPKWSVPAGYLTEHGAKLMTLFGSYDRELLAREQLLSVSGCEDAGKVSVLADSDQRTRESGMALAAGLFPGCAIEVHAQAEGTQDPLFHFAAPVGNGYKALAAAAEAGRIGGNPAGLVDAYRPRLNELEAILTGCAVTKECPKGGAAEPQSLFAIASSLEPGDGDHLVQLRSPLAMASTMVENLLLEYAEGMDAAQVGWGRVDRASLNDLMELHTASSDIERRTEYVARAQSSNMLAHVLESIEQSITGRPVVGALSKPGDRLLILVGHDTNLANLGGALGISWLIDGRRDDTPPGGALVFEVRQSKEDSAFRVNAYYMAQTLDQMRTSAPLTLGKPPEKAAVFIPGCSMANARYSCDWIDFERAAKSDILAPFTR
jgi:4-phytase/acid phosphatase